MTCNVHELLFLISSVSVKSFKTSGCICNDNCATFAYDLIFLNLKNGSLTLFAREVGESKQNKALLRRSILTLITVIGSSMLSAF